MHEFPFLINMWSSLFNTDFLAKSDDTGSPLIREKIIQEIVDMRGSIDTFRKPHPNVVGYNWGENQRHNKRGASL